MHKTQEALLKLAESTDLSRIPLRKIAEIINEPKMSPGVLQHHFAQLNKKKLLFIDRKAKTQQLGADLVDDRFYAIPIVGMASCGPANQFADEAIQGYLHVSKTSLRTNGELFAVKASGDSMDNAKINTLNGGSSPIRDGDYVIVDTSQNSVNDNLDKYVVSIINDLANIKKLSRRNSDYALISESTNPEKYPPIIIDESDNYLINGRVLAVVER